LFIYKKGAETETFVGLEGVMLYRIGFA